MQSKAILDALARLLDLDISSVPVTITGQDPIVCSTHRLGDACAAALALAGAAASKLASERGSTLDTVTIDTNDAIMQLTAAFYTRVNNVALLRLFEDPKLFRNSDFYPSRDGRPIFLLLTYPHLRDIACRILQCPPEREDFTRCIAQWDAFEFEEAVNEKGGCAIAIRTRQEWRSHPQGRKLAQMPVISIEKIGESSPEFLKPLPEDASSLPLNGTKVIDNGHVIAAPMVSRMLAEFGAEVLHISSPDHPDSAAMLNETGLGKRCAFCDLDQEKDRALFGALLAETDVYVCNYRSLERKGFSPYDLAAKRPGLIFVDITGWGRQGSWAGRGGFDQLACAATGFSAEEGTFEEPKLPPTYLLNDYLAAILAFAAVNTALMRRAKQGGSYVVNLNLASVVMWVQDLGAFAPEDVEKLPTIDHEAATHKLLTVEGPNGSARYLPTCIRFGRLKPRFKYGSEPAGASPLAWSCVAGEH